MSTKEGKRWSSKGTAAQLLHKLITDRNWYLPDKNPGPATVWKNYHLFQKYPLKNFRSNYGKMVKSVQKEKGITKKLNDDALESLNKELRGDYDDDDDDDDYDDDDYDDDDDDNDDDDDDDEETFGINDLRLSSPKTKSSSRSVRKSSSSKKKKKKKASSSLFDCENRSRQQVMYSYVPVIWKDKETRKHLTIFIHMPSGTTSRDFKASISEGGTVLSIVFSWTDEILSSKCLIDKAFLNDGSTKFADTEEAIKKLKGGKMDRAVYSEMRIPLGMKVEKRFYNGKNSHSQTERAIKLMRYQKGPKSSGNLTTIAKFEMIGIDDLYVSKDKDIESDFEDRFQDDETTSSFSTLSPSPRHAPRQEYARGGSDATPRRSGGLTPDKGAAGPAKKRKNMVLSESSYHAIVANVEENADVSVVVENTSGDDDDTLMSAI